jgi:L-ascorbate metabolism protein UlaG (beta-lactamase superfamily)
MRIQWYGQSAFGLSGGGATVFIDPFADMAPLTGRGLQFDYPAIEGVDADLLLVTHEHLDHNGVGAIGGDPAILRSTAGTHESPVGEVVGVASEHDPFAGTIGEVDLAFVPVGGSATIDATEAKALVDDLAPRWVVPMHYRTPRTNFLETADAFVKMFDEVHSITEPSFDSGALPPGDHGVVVVVPAAP